MTVLIWPAFFQQTLTNCRPQTKHLTYSFFPSGHPFSFSRLEVVKDGTFSSTLVHLSSSLCLPSPSIIPSSVSSATNLWRDLLLTCTNMVYNASVPRSVHVGSCHARWFFNQDNNNGGKMEAQQKINKEIQNWMEEAQFYSLMWTHLWFATIQLTICWSQNAELLLWLDRS